LQSLIPIMLGMEEAFPCPFGIRVFSRNLKSIRRRKILRTDDPSFPSRLLPGQLAPWMFLTMTSLPPARRRIIREERGNFTLSSTKANFYSCFCTRPVSQRHERFIRTGPVIALSRRPTRFDNNLRPPLSLPLNVRMKNHDDHSNSYLFCVGSYLFFGSDFFSPPYPLGLLFLSYAGASLLFPFL